MSTLFIGTLVRAVKNLMVKWGQRAGKRVKYKENDLFLTYLSSIFLVMFSAHSPTLPTLPFVIVHALLVTLLIKTYIQ